MFGRRNIQVPDRTDDRVLHQYNVFVGFDEVGILGRSPHLFKLAKLYLRATRNLKEYFPTTKITPSRMSLEVIAQKRKETAISTKQKVRGSPAFAGFILGTFIGAMIEIIVFKIVRSIRKRKENTMPAVPDFNTDDKTINDPEWSTFVTTNAVNVTEVPVYGASADEGKIRYTTPPAGTAITHGMNVTVGVIRPGRFVEIIDLVGHSLDTKKITPATAAFLLHVRPTITRRQHPTTGPDVVLSQDIPPGTRVLRGTELKIEATPEAPDPKAARHAAKNGMPRQVYDRNTGRFMPEYASHQGVWHGIKKVVSLGKVK